jgi:hypothetical protein
MKTKYPDESRPSGWSTVCLTTSANRDEVWARITPFGIAIISFSQEWDPAAIEFVYRGQLHRRYPIVKTRHAAIIAATNFVKEIVAKNLKAGSK